jgi:hypothetical protein
MKMANLKVFNAVTVSYPETWKIALTGSNDRAVFTDGKASFAVHPPELSANSAEAIAQSALKKFVPGASVSAQGKATVGGQDAYWIKVGSGGKTAKVIGVDAQTRVVLIESAGSGRVRQDGKGTAVLASFGR